MSGMDRERHLSDEPDGSCRKSLPLEIKELMALTDLQRAIGNSCWSDRLIETVHHSVGTRYRRGRDANIWRKRDYGDWHGSGDRECESTIVAFRRELSNT
jgi:hypothetical protein